MKDSRSVINNRRSGRCCRQVGTGSDSRGAAEEKGCGVGARVVIGLCLFCMQQCCAFDSATADSSVSLQTPTISPN